MANVTGGQRIPGLLTPGSEGPGTLAEQEMGRMVAELHEAQKRRARGGK